MKANCYSSNSSSMFFEVNNRMFRYYLISKEVHELDSLGNVIETYTETDSDEFEEIRAIYNYLK